MPSDLPTVMSTSASAAGLLVGPPYDVAPGTDYLASYSSYGAAVDIASGGDCNPNDLPIKLRRDDVQSQILDSERGHLETGTPGLAGYYFMQGTSMATPHVSAVAAGCSRCTRTGLQGRCAPS